MKHTPRRKAREPERMTLRQARKNKGWTQQQLEAETRQLAALGLGREIDQRVISKLESGDTQEPLNSTAETLEKALGLRRGTLIFGEASEALAS